MEESMQKTSLLKVFLSMVCFFLLTVSCIGQNVIRLWQGAAPGALGTEAKDTPTLTVTLPDSGKATGAAIVICPGGGYGHLARHEGEDYARFLAMHGVTGFVLKYRLGSDGYRHPAMLKDAARALRIVRSGAANWRVRPDKIGIMGSSAGGHLASTLLTHYDSGNPSSPDLVERVSSRPDFGILCYPVISMGPITHQGSKKNLLGESPSQELVDLLSNEQHVTIDTPPCFIWQTFEDNTVSVENSIVFSEALTQMKVPFELHIYQKGRHGLGLADTYPFAHSHPWTQELLRWLRDRGVANE
jgi:acetyl esterase/lipase